MKDNARRSQCQMILQYMKETGGITTMEAFRKFGCTRLSGRIYDLRQEGYAISGETIRKTNRKGKTVTFTRYSLNGGA